MAIRQEAVVLGLTAMLLGYWLYGDVTTGDSRRLSGAKKAPPEFIDYLSPGVDVALPLSGRTAEIGRDLFSPPRDTAPLQTLALDEPPLEPLMALRVPFAWGPEPRAMGAVLQANPRAERVQGLFEGLALEDGSEIAATDFGDDAGTIPSGVLSGLGYAGGDDSSADNLADLVAEDPAVRIAGYRKLYDSIQIPGIKWGRIRNEGRWTLDRRPTEPVLFEEVDPTTGQLAFPGVPAISYERERIKEFAFAETTANLVELQFVAFGDPLRSAEHADALDFAQICIGLRSEVPRALEIAHVVCTRALAISGGDDVEATLLLGRIREAGFDFDGAYDIYQGLLADGYRSHAEIHVRLGDLVSQFRLFDKAEQHYREALNVSSTNWLAHWRFGRFLLQQERGIEALKHFADAERREPSGQERAHIRVDIRTDHGRALLFLGRTDKALVAFKRALNADSAHPAALAGVVAAASFLGTPEAQAQADEAMGALGDELPEADFELALALGMARTAEGDWENAKRELLTAASTDPFRAYAAYRALSWLAELTGHSDEALGYVNQAFEGNPTDAWTLYQRGRQMFAAEDLVGAEANLRAALDLELNFMDALVAMAELKRAQGESLAAERYYERALEVDPSRAVVHSRRGFNLFGLGDPVAAEASFEEALRLMPDLASARLGDAWSRYVAGDSQEAITRLGELVEARRNAPDDDAYRSWAQSQAERIVDHEEKEVWTDLFERRAGNIGNGWIAAEGFGPTVELRDGAVRIEGAITAKGSSRMLTELPSDTFLAFEAEVTIEVVNNGVRAGLFVSRERQGRDGQSQVQAMIALARNPDGSVQAGTIRQGEIEIEWEDLYAASEDWPVGVPMRLSIEKRGTGSDTTLSLYLDGVPLLANRPMSRLGTSTQMLRFGLFAEGDVGRRAQISIDNVRVVRRTR